MTYISTACKLATYCRDHTHLMWSNCLLWVLHLSLRRRVLAKWVSPSRHIISFGVSVAIDFLLMKCSCVLVYDRISFQVYFACVLQKEIKNVVRVFRSFGYGNNRLPFFVRLRMCLFTFRWKVGCRRDPETRHCCLLKTITLRYSGIEGTVVTATRRHCWFLFFSFLCFYFRGSEREFAF